MFKNFPLSTFENLNSYFHSFTLNCAYIEVSQRADIFLILNRKRQLQNKNSMIFHVHAHRHTQYIFAVYSDDLLQTLESHVGLSFAY